MALNQRNIGIGDSELVQDWVTLTTYDTDEEFSYNGNVYITLIPHIASTVAADLAAGKIALVGGTSSGASDLASVLAIGYITGGSPIELSNGDYLQSYSSAFATRTKFNLVSNGTLGDKIITLLSGDNDWSLKEAKGGILVNSSEIILSHGADDALFEFKGVSGFSSIFDASGITATRTYTLQDANGTIALTSDIPAAPSLAGTLAVGNTTGGNDISISSGDSIVFSASSSIALSANILSITNTAGTEIKLDSPIVRLTASSGVYSDTIYPDGTKNLGSSGTKWDHSYVNNGIFLKKLTVGTTTETSAFKVVGDATVTDAVKVLSSGLKQLLKITNTGFSYIGQDGAYNNRTSLTVYSNNGGSKTGNTGLYVTGNINNSSNSILCYIRNNILNGTLPTIGSSLLKVLGGFDKINSGNGARAIEVSMHPFVGIGMSPVNYSQLSIDHIYKDWTGSVLPATSLITADIFNTVAVAENDASNRSKYGARISSTGAFTNAGAGISTNTGLEVIVSGGDVNYAAYFTGGNVGMGTSTPDASAILDLTSTTQGFLPPRMTTTQRNAISSPASGLIVFDTTLSEWWGYDGSSWGSF